MIAQKRTETRDLFFSTHLADDSRSSTQQALCKIIPVPLEKAVWKYNTNTRK